MLAAAVKFAELSTFGFAMSRLWVGPAQKRTASGVHSFVGMQKRIPHFVDMSIWNATLIQQVLTMCAYVQVKSRNWYSWWHRTSVYTELEETNALKE